MNDSEAKKQAQIQFIKQQIIAKQQGTPLMKDSSARFSPLIAKNFEEVKNEKRTNERVATGSDQNSDIDNLSSDDIRSIVNSEKEMMKKRQMNRNESS